MVFAPPPEDLDIPDLPHWEGVRGASEHRTVGQRAWCHDDGTWCYPRALCQCCFHASPDWEGCPTCGGEGFVKVGMT